MHIQEAYEFDNKKRKNIQESGDLQIVIFHYLASRPSKRV